MAYGGFHPYPRRFGGNRHDGKPLTEVIAASIAGQRGPAYDTDDESTTAWLENQAYARALAYDGWETNERLALQWDPVRVTDMLPRWEAIFKLYPAPTDSDRTRRQALAARWQRFAGATNHARMVTALIAALGPFLYAIEYIDLAHAVVHAPDGSYPLAQWNATVDPPLQWYSTVAHFLIRLQKPAYATEEEFYEAAGKVFATLDPIVSAFVTFDWYRPGPVSSAVNGISAAGFYLDDEHNLDNEIFDS